MAEFDWRGQQLSEGDLVIGPDGRAFVVTSTTTAGDQSVHLLDVHSGVRTEFSARLLRLQRSGEAVGTGRQGPAGDPGEEGPPGPAGATGATGTVAAAHATTHQPGGSDAMAVDAAAATGSLRTIGTAATAACAGNDARLSDSRAPSGTASGDLGGTYPSPTVKQITTSTPETLTIAPIADLGVLIRAGTTITTTPPTTWIVASNDQVTNAHLRDSAALSVIGRSANSTGDPSDIAASAASAAVLRESGSVLGFGTVATAGIADAAITLAKMANLATDRLIGRDTAGTGVPEALSVSGGLEFSGTGIQRSALSGDVTATAGSNTMAIAAGAVTIAACATAAKNYFELHLGINTGASVSSYSFSHEGYDTTYAGIGVAVACKLVEVCAVVTSNTTGINWTLRIRKNGSGSDSDTFVFALSSSAWTTKVTSGAPVTGASFSAGDYLYILADGGATTGGVYGHVTLGFQRT